MNYYFDTEFIDNGKTVELISMGIVAEDGRELYIEIDDVHWENAHDWVLQNVKPHLWMQQEHKKLFAAFKQKGNTGGVVSRAQAQILVSEFCNPLVYGNPVFWAWFATYDWFCMCQLFGGFLNVPYRWPNLSFEIYQEYTRHGHPSLPVQSGQKHNALEDAKWNKQVMDMLTKM